MANNIDANHAASLKSCMKSCIGKTKPSVSNESEEIDNEIYKYRWILLTCSTIVCVLTWGVSLSVGVYYVRWVEYFEATKAEVAVVGAISSGMTNLPGPIYDVVVERLGFRRTGILGGMLTVVGFIGSAFSINLFMLCIFYGVFVGIGLGFGYFSASVAINHYFIKQRSFADGIAGMGSGIGGFILSLFGQHLINVYDWRGAMGIMAGVSAHIIVLFQLSIDPGYLRQFPTLSNWTSKTEVDNNPMETSSNAQPQNVGNAIVATSTANNEVTVIRQQPSTPSWLVRCLQLYKTPIFLLIMASEFFCWLCNYVPFMHLAERAILLGMDVDTAAWLASTLSIATVVGRPVICSLPRVFNVDVFYLYGGMNFVAGVITILSPFADNHIGLFVYAALYGFVNVGESLVRASAAKLLGTEKFSLAYGWIVFINGVALFIGPPIAGWIYDISNSYDYSFHATGAGLVISGLLPSLKNLAMRK